MDGACAKTETMDLFVRILRMVRSHGSASPFHKGNIPVIETTSKTLNPSNQIYRSLQSKTLIGILSMLNFPYLIVFHKARGGKQGRKLIFTLPFSWLIYPPPSKAIGEVGVLANRSSPPLACWGGTSRPPHHSSSNSKTE